MKSEFIKQHTNRQRTREESIRERRARTFDEQLQNAKTQPEVLKKVLKEDPEDPKGEGLNDDRSGWAEAALREFAMQTGSDLEDLVADLMGDLAHFCDRVGLDWQEQVQRGRLFYEEETAD